MAAAAAHEHLAADRGDQRRACRRGRRVRRARPAGPAGCACAAGVRDRRRAITCITRSRSDWRRSRYVTQRQHPRRRRRDFFLAGILLFSGSLYLLALTGLRALGIVTPFGGVCFLLGWGFARLRRNPIEDVMRNDEQVLVAGSGIAGLGAALAFGGGTRGVTILDRDPPPPAGSAEEAFYNWERKGATQLRHSHAFHRPPHHADPRPLSRPDGRTAGRRHAPVRLRGRTDAAADEPIRAGAGRRGPASCSSAAAPRWNSSCGAMRRGCRA